MIFLIFIVAYHHWRVFVISYWLRGAGDRLIACARAFLNSFLLYSLPLNFIKTLKRTLLWTCWLIGIMFYTCIVKKIIGKKMNWGLYRQLIKFKWNIEREWCEFENLLGWFVQRKCINFVAKKIISMQAPLLPFFKLCALNNWWLIFVYILLLVHAGSLP